MMDQREKLTVRNGNLGLCLKCVRDTICPPCVEWQLRAQTPTEGSLILETLGEFPDGS